ncbi:MAG: OsmC family protein [Acidimicrobiales bacterium]
MPETHDGEDVESSGAPTSHRYQAHCHWQGATAHGYSAYTRTHVGSTPPSEANISLSADVAFGGNPHEANPEQLLVLAAASCQLLSFLAVAARARIDVRRYDDEAEGIMPTDSDPMRITAIHLHPRILVGSGTSPERLAHLVEVAHRECYIANSLACEVSVEPTFEAAADDPT